MAADSGRLGDSIVYLTNSAGGLRAMVTTTKAAKANIAGIVTYESIGYVFPIGDPESPAPCTDPGACGFGPIGVPLEEFRKLAKLKSIQFVWGDHRSGPDAANALVCGAVAPVREAHQQVRRACRGADAGR